MGGGGVGLKLQFLKLWKPETTASPFPSRLPDTGPEPERHEPIHPGSGRGGWLKKLWGPFLAAGLVVLKFGAKLKALLFLLPKMKLFTTSATMLVSIGAYALIWGWTFAVGFVLLLLLHEMGHVIQLRREGIEASAPMFIPFLGAVIAAKSMGDDAAAEARVGLAGPVLGSIAALVPLGIWLATGNEFWQALAYVGFLINLFNLLPVLPLDGGRAMAALSPMGVGGRLRGPDRADGLLPEPDPAARAAVRRAGELAPLEEPKHTRVARLSRHPGPDQGAGRAHLPRARGAARGGGLRDLPRSATSATSSPLKRLRSW